jgi:autoinducer 2-degrading protein
VAALEHEDSPPRASEVPGGDQPIVARADDDRVVHATKGNNLTRMIALMVSLKVKPELRDRFLAVAEDDSICSVRDEGGGCLRFDVLQDHADENHFWFYEVYRDEAAHQAHTTYPHYARWNQARGEVLAETPTRELAAVVFPGDYK